MQIDAGKLKLLMAEQELTCTAVAERSGLSKQTMTRVRKLGRCNAATVRKLAWALDVPPEELIPGGKYK